MYRPSQTPHLAVSSKYGSRQGPSPRSGRTRRRRPAGPGRTNGRTPTGPTTRRPGDPWFDARNPRLALNATGISTAAPRERAQAERRARRDARPTRGPDGVRRAARGRTRPRREPRVPLHRVSGETMRVVVFQGRRGDGRPRGRPSGPPSTTYATPRHVSEQCQIRVKLNRVFFPR